MSVETSFMNHDISEPFLGEITRIALELRETQKVRDEWCAEYTRVRNELEAVKKDLEYYRARYLRYTE